MSFGKGVLAVDFKSRFRIAETSRLGWKKHIVFFLCTGFISSIYLFFYLKTKLEWQSCLVCQSTDAIVGQHQDFLLINNTLIFIPSFYFEKVLIKLSQSGSIIDMKYSHYLNKFSESFVYNLYDKVQHTPDDDVIK